jgi:glycosyltransferase involved in cell wall biosynthesis
MWRIFFQSFNTWLCKKYIPLTAGMTTVGKGLADEYEKNFNVRPAVIVNANNYFEKEPAPVQEDRIRLVHVGIANPSRKLELMIDMMEHLDGRFSLDLFLLTPGFASSKTKNYIQHLKDNARDNQKIRILPPIKSKEVVQTINLYDMGVFLLPPINFNYENTLPNKLFDFIQARLGVAIGPTKEMAEIVNQYGIGVVSANFNPQSLAGELNRLSKKDIEIFKKNAAKAARDFNAENNAITLQKLVKEIISS